MNTGPQDLSKLVIIDYTNHRGERALRGVHPYDINFKSTEWHPAPQWVLRAHDYNKSAVRDFALLSVHSWQLPGKQPTIDASLAKQLQASIERNGRMSNRLQKLMAMIEYSDDLARDVVDPLQQILKDEEPTWPGA